MSKLTLELLCACVLISCSSKREQEVTPWGTTVEEESEIININNESSDSIAQVSVHPSLTDIVSGGELIILTVSGPETYYDYHGHGLGLQYLMCEKFAENIGVSLRVEVCADSAEVVRRYKEGEGDIAVFADFKSWIVEDKKGELFRELKAWYTPERLANIKKEEKNILSFGMVKRRIYPFMLNRKDAVISHYDEYFRNYASIAHVDWTLLAAQCYQESCFDPKAHSWAGACGLMQILPSTADHLGLSRAEIYQPAANIQAAARYMAELQGKFSDVHNRQERIHFALASYNGGYHHVRDAMALAQKYGKNPYRWADVKTYILGLQNPQYYRDAVVKNGYMRGSETANYVDRIMERWAQYRGATKGKYSSSINASPQPAKRANKWDK